MSMRALGIDLGGSGFRLGVFDTVTGALVGNFIEQQHEDVSDPARVQASMAKAIQVLEWRGPIGIGFPGVVVNDVVETAPNLGDAWIGTDFSSLHPFHEGQVSILNDADAVALGELYFGVGHQGHDKVLTLTIGTGLGTTVHENGTLVPNLEYGRLPHPTRGGLLEEHLSGRARREANLSLEQWAGRFQEGLDALERLVEPGLIVLYGGIMEHWSSIKPLLSTRAMLLPARLNRTAGPLGAAWYATHRD